MKPQRMDPELFKLLKRLFPASGGMVWDEFGQIPIKFLGRRSEYDALQKPPRAIRKEQFKPVTSWKNWSKQ